MFFDFSSAFSTIQPLLLGEKLKAAEVDVMVSWVMDYGCSSSASRGLCQICYRVV